MSFVPGTNASTKALGQLWSMLATKRPDGSKTELNFLITHLQPLGMTVDKFGNAFKVIGKDPIVAWSCHTDTVHREEGSQRLILDKDSNIRLHKDEKSNCLGADDTAGAWLMVEMIRAERPGMYIFHRAEEVGTKGSKYIVDKTPKRMAGIQAVIAFDRRDYNSVITFQRGMRCCSDDFGNSLAKKLGEKYELDKGGVWTDSASYVDMIGECTNVSVGYFNEHSSSERLNLPHLLRLRDAVVELDTRDLVFKRKAGEKESRWGNNNGHTWHGNRHGHWGGHDFETGDNDYYNSYKSEWGHWDGAMWKRAAEQPDEFGLTGRDFCPDNFQGYFMRNNVYVKCTLSRWEERCKEIAAIKKKAEDAKAETAKAEGKKTTSVVPLIPRITPQTPSEYRCIACNIPMTPGNTCSKCNGVRYAAIMMRSHDKSPETPNDKEPPKVLSSATSPVFANKVNETEQRAQMKRVITDHTEEVVAMLWDWGFDTAGLLEEVMAMKAQPGDNVTTQ